MKAVAYNVCCLNEILAFAGMMKAWRISHRLSIRVQVLRNMMKLFQNYIFYLNFILYKPNKLSGVFILHKLKGSFIFKKFKNFYKKQFIKNEKGQVIVEYILLLVVSTVLALTLINLVTVDPDKNSPIFSYWGKLLKVIGLDIST